MAATLPTSNCGKAIEDVTKGKVSFTILTDSTWGNVGDFSISSGFRGDVTPSVGEPHSGRI